MLLVNIINKEYHIIVYKCMSKLILGLSMTVMNFKLFMEEDPNEMTWSYHKSL